MQDHLLSDSELLERLQVGLENDYITPWFQPVMDPAAVDVLSVEMLPRCIDPEYGVISPTTFLHVANRHNLLSRIGAALLSKTCAIFKRWEQRHIAPRLVTVNLTGLELQTPDIVERISGALAAWDVSPESLGIEVVESVAYDDGHEAALKTIETLTEMGMKIVLDDLGSDAADTENIRRLNASMAKLERTIVNRLTDDAAALDQVRELAELMHALDIPVIAKGVETRVQIDRLVDAGCVGQQGYAIARPMPSDSFTEWLDLNTGWGSNAA